MEEYKYTGKYYIPTSIEVLDKRIADEQKGITRSERRIAKIEEYPIEKQKHAELKVLKDDVIVRKREIAYLQEDHFVKRNAMHKEYYEYLKNNGVI